MKIRKAVALLLVCVSAGLSAQDADNDNDNGDTDATATDATEVVRTYRSLEATGAARVRQITHMPEYQPVPGDQFTLVIDFGARIGGARETQAADILRYENILLQPDYTIRIPFIGEISVQGMRFQDVRREVIRRVNARVPSEFVDFQIVSLAVFDVLVYGRVVNPGLRSVDSISRLARAVLIGDGISPEGSWRRVTVHSPDGESREYDILRFLNEGDLDQNPFLRPGDRVLVPRREQSVRLSGAVNHSGEYEIFPGETLGDILEIAGGLTPAADRRRISINRVDERNVYGIRRLGEDEYPREVLRHGDQIAIPSTTQTTDRIIVEGALYGSPTSSAVIDTDPLSVGARQNIPNDPIRTTLAFTPGMTLLRVLESLGGPTPFADPERSFINRTSTGQMIELPELLEIWSERDMERDMDLLPGDHVVIPATSARVLVSGDVSQTTFPYVSGRTVFDYVLQAGGLTRGDALERRFYLMDSRGQMIPTELTATVRAGDSIFVARPDPIVVTGMVNSPGRHSFNRVHNVGDYILLSGGINTNESNQRRIFFVDAEGNRTRADLMEPVEPGTVIHLDRDGWGKFKRFAQDFGIVRTFLTALGATLTLNAIYDGALIPFP